jgi:hypothetical protein
VAAAYTKNGQTAELPLPIDLAGDLAAFVATLAPNARRTDSAGRRAG